MGCLSNTLKTLIYAHNWPMQQIDTSMLVYDIVVWWNSFLWDCDLFSAIFTALKYSCDGLMLYD